MFFSKKKKSAPPATTRAPAVDPSFIGQNTFFEGQISCDGELHIDGEVRGQVRASLCVIDRHGIVIGNVSGDIVHVRGRVTGPIQGSAVYVYKGAHIEGDVFNDTISIEPGAFVDGAIRRSQPQPSVAPTLNDAFSLKPAAKGLRVVGSDK